MLNQEIKEKSQIKKSKEHDEIQTLRTLGIVWLCLGGANPVFSILGLVFLLSSVVKSKRIKANESISHGGLS